MCNSNKQTLKIENTKNGVGSIKVIMCLCLLYNIVKKFNVPRYHRFVNIFASRELQYHIPQLEVLLGNSQCLRIYATQSM
jgi:hypothetical protein